MVILRIIISLAILIPVVTQRAASQGIPAARGKVSIVVRVCGIDAADIPSFYVSPLTAHDGRHLVDVHWKRIGRSLLAGDFAMRPAAESAEIDTAHCWTGPFYLAVLSGHTRHLSLGMEQTDREHKHVKELTRDMMIAGDLPFRGLSVSYRYWIGDEAQRVWYPAEVDDGAYYVPWTSSDGFKGEISIFDQNTTLTRTFASTGRAKEDLIRRNVTATDFAQNAKWR